VKAKLNVKGKPKLKTIFWK